PAWIEATLARPWALHDHDALRRVALAAVSLAPRQSVGLAQHYADLCARVEGAGALAWPRRTRGARLRVITLPGLDDSAARAQAVLATLPAERFDVTTLRAQSDDAQKRRLAALDAGVIVDLAGLSEPL